MKMILVAIWHFPLKEVLLQMIQIVSEFNCSPLHIRGFGYNVKNKCQKTYLTPLDDL